MNIQTRQLQPNYWFFFVPFAICALLGFAGVLAAELLMPDNAGGVTGRLVVYRHVGTMSVIWSLIAMWSWHKIQLSRRLKAK